jgi:hypothetical protein
LGAFEMTPMDLNNLTVRLAPAQCQQLVGLLIAINRLPPSDLAVHLDIIREFAKYTATAGDVVSTDVFELLAQELRRPPCLDTQARVQAAIERAAKNWPATTQGTRDGLLSSLVGALRSAPVKGTTTAFRLSKKNEFTNLSSWRRKIYNAATVPREFNCAVTRRPGAGSWCGLVVLLSHSQIE